MGVAYLGHPRQLKCKKVSSDQSVKISTLKNFPLYVEYILTKWLFSWFEFMWDSSLVYISLLQNSLNTSDFAELSAPLLYDMFKAHSEYPLHLAIHHLREDVVFLFLIEHNAQVG